MELLGIFVGLPIGGIIIWLWLKSKLKETEGLNRVEIEQERSKTQVAEERVNHLETDLSQEKNNLKALQQEYLECQNNLSKSRADYANLQQRLSEQKQEIEQLNKKFSTEFENLANKILDEKSKKFADQNKANLGELLNPLRERIGEFQKKIEDTNKESIERNTALASHIKHLSELNKDITEKADNLTKALKGDNKTQGNWGEVILERILEKSGLEKGREYETQVSETNEEGKRYQPDVVIKLPDNKNIIVDAKVSLIAYERSVNAATEEESQLHLKAHIQSVRAHLKGLGEKNYQDLYGVTGLDFVLLFIPIEPAFTLATQHDSELFNDAYAKNIVIVSPSTLIATLRTISSIWKQEYQNKNALEIARQGGLLYDKFVGFTEDLVTLGKQLNTVQGTYQESMKKLSTGSGNLVRRVEGMRNLGLKPKKDINQKLIDRSED